MQRHNIDILAKLRQRMSQMKGKSQIIRVCMTTCCQHKFIYYHCFYFLGKTSFPTMDARNSIL